MLGPVCDISGGVFCHTATTNRYSYSDSMSLNEVDVLNARIRRAKAPGTRREDEDEQRNSFVSLFFADRQKRPAFDWSVLC